MFSVLVTPRTALDKSAIPHAKEVYVLLPGDMLSLFERARTMLTTLRTKMVEEMDEEFKERILSELIQTDLAPQAIQENLTARRATTLTTST